MIRVALAQINPTVGDLKGNRQKILDYIRQAEAQDADIVAFPEMVVCGYPPQDLLFKDHFIKDNVQILKSIVPAVKALTVIVGFVDIGRNKELYNAAAVIHDGKIRGIYHKRELPNYGVFDEKRYFQPGNTKEIYAFNSNRFGVSICEDIWVEQTILKEQARQGARLLINISSSPYEVGKLEERKKLLRKWAKRLNTFICYANLVGGQDELVFDGSSLIVNPKGTIVASGKHFKEDLIVADLEIPQLKKTAGKHIIVLSRSYKKKEKLPIKPHLSEDVSQVERVYRALVLGTRDYVRKNGFKKVLVGISGGIDSALVAAIAVDAIGKENVIGVTIPSRYSSEGTRSDAHQLARNLGFTIKEIFLEHIFKAYLDTLKEEFAGLEPNIAEENIQARIRGNILMALSNKFGWLVLTTGNKSEVAVGYCTLYGDMSGGFAVIKDVPKTQVYDLVRFRNGQGDGRIPDSIIERAPTAELRFGQKDQDSLPPYNILDGILKEYVEKHSSFMKMSKNCDINTVKKIIQLVDYSEYKRRQSPPGIKITPRSFDKDWRLPITNKYKEF